MMHWLLSQEERSKTTCSDDYRVQMASGLHISHYGSMSDIVLWESDMAYLVPRPPERYRFLVDIPIASERSVTAAVQRAGGTIVDALYTPAVPLTEEQAINTAVRNASPTERTFLEMLLNAHPTAVARETIAAQVERPAAQLHLIAMAPFFRRVNRHLPVKQSVNIDNFIERSRTAEGDVAYRLRPGFKEIVVRAFHTYRSQP